MNIRKPNGVLSQARYLSSPHCDERPHDTIIDMAVIHGISLPPQSIMAKYRLLKVKEATHYECVRYLICADSEKTIAIDVSDPNKKSVLSQVKSR